MTLEERLIRARDLMESEDMMSLYDKDLDQLLELELESLQAAINKLMEEQLAWYGPIKQLGAKSNQCECGATAAGYNSHVHWCPINTTSGS